LSPSFEKEPSLHSGTFADLDKNLTETMSEKLTRFAAEIQALPEYMF